MRRIRAIKLKPTAARAGRAKRQPTQKRTSVASALSRDERRQIIERIVYPSGTYSREVVERKHPDLYYGPDLGARMMRAHDAAKKRLERDLQRCSDAELIAMDRQREEDSRYVAKLVAKRELEEERERRERTYGKKALRWPHAGAHAARKFSDADYLRWQKQYAEIANGPPQLGRRKAIKELRHRLIENGESVSESTLFLRLPSLPFQRRQK